MRLISRLFGRDFVCPMCGAKFRSRKELEAHKASSHKSEVVAPPFVPYNKDTATKCLCPKCPVQVESKCASPLNAKWGKVKEALEAGKETVLPKPSESPIVYCSKGQSMCNDLDFGKICTCPVCQVFLGYDLRVGDPDLLEGYYCRDGMAQPKKL